MLVVGVALVMHKIVKAAGDALVSVQWQLYDIEQAVERGCGVVSFKLTPKDIAIFLVAAHDNKQGFVAIFLVKTVENQLETTNWIDSRALKARQRFPCVRCSDLTATAMRCV